MCLLIIKVERTKSNKLVYIKNDQLSDRHKQATVKMLDYTGYTIANKTERSKPGYHDFWLLNLNFSALSITDDKIKSGHFPPNVFGFCINIISFADET